MTNYKKDEIYIDCQPVNSEGETLVEKNEKGSEPELFDFNVILNNPVLSFMIGVILLYILIKLMTVTINKMYKATEIVRSKGGSVMSE
jgi:hypothetical protein